MVYGIPHDMYADKPHRLDRRPHREYATIAGDYICNLPNTITTAILQLCLAVLQLIWHLALCLPILIWAFVYAGYRKTRHWCWRRNCDCFGLHFNDTFGMLWLNNLALTKRPLKSLLRSLQTLAVITVFLLLFFPIQAWSSPAAATVMQQQCAHRYLLMHAACMGAAWWNYEPPSNVTIIVPNNLSTPKSYWNVCNPAKPLTETNPDMFQPVVILSPEEVEDWIRRTQQQEASRSTSIPEVPAPTTTSISVEQIAVKMESAPTATKSMPPNMLNSLSVIESRRQISEMTNNEIFARVAEIYPTMEAEELMELQTILRVSACARENGFDVSDKEKVLLLCGPCSRFHNLPQHFDLCMEMIAEEADTFVDIYDRYTSDLDTSVDAKLKEHRGVLGSVRGFFLARWANSLRCGLLRPVLIPIPQTTWYYVNIILWFPFWLCFTVISNTVRAITNITFAKVVKFVFGGVSSTLHSIFSKVASTQATLENLIQELI
jgi:hypothetical protein